MATLPCASHRINRSSRTARYCRLGLLGLVSLAGTTLLLASCLTPVYAQPVKGVKMTQKFKNISNQAANDFHLETSLFILKSNPPTSDVFKNAKVDPGNKLADFDKGNVASGGTHEVTWHASGKTSKIVDHYFTKDGNSIANSSALAALTNDAEYNLIPGGYQTALLTYNDTSVPLSGVYTIYAKPQSHYFSAAWNDLSDARLLQGPTLYALSPGASDSPGNYALFNNEYLLVLGTANDGSTTELYSTAFSASGAPEPGTMGLLGIGFGVLGFRYLVQRRGRTGTH